MAKAKTKGASKRSRPKKKSSRKKKREISQLIRIIAGLSILVFLVAAAGFIAHYFFQRKAPLFSTGKTTAPQSIPKTEAPFEIYPIEKQPPTRKKIKPYAGQRPRVAIIIDDLGNDRRIAENFMEIDAPLTISILPQSPFTKQIVKKARQKGLDIMLHQPMEPNELSRVNPGPGVLLTSMSPDDIIRQLKANLDEIPGIKGVNNHMGSKMTASAPQMRQIFSVLKKRGLFFVDSRTTSKSVCRLSAGLLQIPFAERDVFLDHRQNAVFIKKQIKALIRIAQKDGHAIGIAHPHIITCQVLKDSMPELKKAVEIVPVSQVVHMVDLNSGKG
jgi:polysaccharide deacetylase 2 family uncharacterized protein YibQ